MDNQYHEGQLVFKDGHLASAEVPGVEKWNYEGYHGSLPFPDKISLERLYTSNGMPQVSVEYNLVGSAPDSRDLDGLLSTSSIGVLDRRGEPVKQFTYEKGQGSIIQQASHGVPDLSSGRPVKLVNPPNYISISLIAFGLVVIILVSVRQLLRSK